MTSHADSQYDPFLHVFLTLSLLALLVMISIGVSPSWQAAIPAIATWVVLAASYGAWRFARSWKPARRVT